MRGSTLRASSSERGVSCAPQRPPSSVDSSDSEAGSAAGADPAPGSSTACGERVRPVDQGLRLVDVALRLLLVERLSAECRRLERASDLCCERIAIIRQRLDLALDRAVAAVVARAPALQ